LVSRAPATTGIKLTIFYDAFDRARFFNGFLTSVRLMTLCILCGVAIGIVGTWGSAPHRRASSLPAPAS
jgi:hypothetical protein